MLESETKIYSKVTLAQALSFAEQNYVYGVKVGIVNGQPQLKSLPGFHLQDIPEVTLDELSASNGQSPAARLAITKVYSIYPLRFNVSEIISQPYIMIDNPEEKDASLTEYNDYKHIIGYELECLEGVVNFRDGMSLQPNQSTYIQIDEIHKLSDLKSVTIENAMLINNQVNNTNNFTLRLTCGIGTVTNIVVGAFNLDDGIYYWDSYFSHQLTIFSHYKRKMIFVIPNKETSQLLGTSTILIQGTQLKDRVASLGYKGRSIWLASNKPTCSNSDNANWGVTKHSTEQVATKIKKQKGILGIFDAFSKG